MRKEFVRNSTVAILAAGLLAVAAVAQTGEASGQVKIEGGSAPAAKAQVKALEDLTTAQREAGAYSRELKDVLSKHDLGALAKRKPGLIERRVNDGSDRALRLLEQSTQAAAADGGQAASAAGAARP